MKKFLVFLCAATLVFGLAISSNATSIYYEATNVSGTGTITYGTGNNINNAPVFSFSGSGTVDQNLNLFTPGEYTISFSLLGLEVDANEDENWYPFDDYNFSTGPINIPFTPSLQGTYGALTWDVDLNSGFTVTYDFDFNPGPNSNASVNTSLAGIDFQYSNFINGVMDANVRWDTLRVELNPVPEPSTALLLGAGLLGLVGYNRKRFSKKG